MNLTEPYYAVIFTSTESATQEGHKAISEVIYQEVQQAKGFLGVDNASDTQGNDITVSYWKSKEAIELWKNNTLHKKAKQLGIEKWFQSYTIRIAKVESEYSFQK